MTLKILSSRGRRATKPSRPRKDYPLFPHDSGQWAKKVRGKIYYFGTWDDPVTAERRWDRDKLALIEGRNPEGSTAGDSIGWLCNAFMDSKELQRQRGELTKRALDDYHRVAKAIAKHFGKGRRLDTIRASEFEVYRNGLPDSWGPTTINNHLRLARTLFKYANDIEASERPIRYAIGLKSVPKATIRKHEAKQHAKEFTLAEVHQLLAVAGVPMRAFILLGINAAYGTADIARLKEADIDFGGHWLGEPRGKTGMARGCWLWPETLVAIREAIDARQPSVVPKFEGLAFLTTHRRPWAEDGSTSHPLTQTFRKVKQAAKIDRKGVGHYSLRHTFETIAGDTKDQPAVSYIMGHHDPSMAAVYREGIDPARVTAVCKYVRSKFLAANLDLRRI